MIWINHRIRTAVAEALTSSDNPWATTGDYANWLVEVHLEGTMNHTKVMMWIWEHGPFPSQTSSGLLQNVASTSGTSSGIPSSSFPSASLSDQAEASRWCKDHGLKDVHLQALISVGVSGSVNVQQLKDLTRDNWTEVKVTPLVCMEITKACDRDLEK